MMLSKSWLFVDNFQGNLARFNFRTKTKFKKLKYFGSKAGPLSILSTNKYYAGQIFKMAVAGNHLATALHTSHINYRIGHG